LTGDRGSAEGSEALAPRLDATHHGDVNLIRGPYEFKPPRIVTRDEVEAALARHPELAGTFDLLVSDISATLAWPRTEAAGFVIDTARGILDFLEDEKWTFAERVIENVQQRIHDEFIDTSWPECPAHGRHPLWLTGEPPWLWMCTGVRVPLGGLG
jgi:hypothetical protein